jgi:hypothetical protein
MDATSLKFDPAADASELRAYSKPVRDGLVSSQRQWQSQGSEGAESLTTVLLSLQSEASFFGYPATARLARKASMLVEASRLGGSPSVELKDLLGLCLATLVNLVAEPWNAPLAGKVDAIVNRVDATVAKFASSTTTRSVFRFGNVATSAMHTSPSLTSKHEDLDIYSSDVMDGMEKCSDEESWIVTQLASAAEDLAGRYSDIRPAHKLMSILKGHRFFQHMDRVCIVGLMPRANQLVVVDSCIHDRLRDQGIKNRMPSGYSCFVNPQGSLFQMKPGVLRIFSDSRVVLDSFAKAGKPAQRSIAYVAESGLRSGICLAIGRGETVQGYLFMNSFQPNLFDHVMRDYAPLLSLFSLMGTVALDAAGFHAVDGASASGERDLLSTHSEVFEAATFKRLVETTVGRMTACNCCVTVHAGSDSKFLFIPAVIVPAIAEIACRTGAANVGVPSNFSVNVCVEGEQVALEVDRTSCLSAGMGQEWLERIVARLGSSYVNRPVAIATVGKNVTLRIPFEPVSATDQSVLYSVAY